MIALIVGALLAIGACGDGSSGTGFKQVSPAARTYSQDDFLAIGFKVVREYNVEGLPGATSASFGFWRVSGQAPRDYELRFYASHEEAVRQGTPLAEEVTGEDALIIGDEMTWKEGIKDRRHQLLGGKAGGTGGLAPSYMDYAIYGNVVLLCEGVDSAQSLEVCAGLVEAIGGITEV